MISAGTLQWVARNSATDHQVGRGDRGRTERASLSRAGGATARPGCRRAAYRAARQRPTLPALTQQSPLVIPEERQHRPRGASHLQLARPMTKKYPSRNRTVRPTRSGIDGRLPTRTKVGFYPVAESLTYDQCGPWQPSRIITLALFAIRGTTTPRSSSVDGSVTGKGSNA